MHLSKGEGAAGIVGWGGGWLGAAWGQATTAEF